MINMANVFEALFEAGIHVFTAYVALPKIHRTTCSTPEESTQEEGNAA